MPPTFRKAAFLAGGLVLALASSAQAQGTGCGGGSYEQIQRQLSQVRAAASSAGCTGILALFRGQACFGINERVRVLEYQLAQAARARPPQPVSRSIFQPLSPERLIVPDCVPTPRAQARVVCVRICDGYYFPVNHRISQKNLPKDEQKCLGQYPEGAAALYIDRSGGENIATMVSFTGKLKYGDQPFAFAFQKTFNPNCPRPGANLAAAEKAAPIAEAAQVEPLPVALDIEAEAEPAIQLEVRRVGPPFVTYFPHAEATALQRAAATPVVLPEKVDAPVEPVVATRVDERVQ